MPIQIGRAEPGYDDPVGLMVACHQRIKGFLKTLSIATKLAEQRLLEREEQAAVSRALRYFREAAPNHTADEEQDVFPALIRHAPQAVDAVRALEEDHARADLLHARVDAIGEEWLRVGSIAPAPLQEIASAVSELEALYSSHIHTEETELFPWAARVLNKTELDAIGVNMAARRGREYTAVAG